VYNQPVIGLAGSFCMIVDLVDKLIDRIIQLLMHRKQMRAVLLET
jgi:hypothetical protein